MKQIINTMILLLTLSSCSQGSMTWSRYAVDGHRTGVSPVLGPDVESAVGKIDSLYKAPNGQTFACGSVPAVAKILLEAQPKMAYLKEVIGYSAKEMPRNYPECELYNWTADAIFAAVGTLTGKKVDVAITNYGGIRVDMPQGEILIDDIKSMFPFKNYFAYIKIMGSDLRKIFDQMASDKIMPVSGAKWSIKDGKAVEILIAGRPLDDGMMYGLGTVDFLLDGGDGLHLAADAKEVILTDTRIYDWMVPYIKTICAGGEMVDASVEGRVTRL